MVLIRKWPALDTSGFRDSIHHWRKIRDSSRFIQALPDQPSYAPSQVREIVGNILLFQRENGGWPKDYDMLAVLTEEQRKVLRATHNRADTSFDNHNLHSQVDYLAHAYHVSGEETWRDACLRGLDFMFAAQLPNGGFPQRFPKPKGFSAYVTFNDGVMIGILNVMQDIGDGLPHWSWLDDARRQKARDAVRAGNRVHSQVPDSRGRSPDGVVPATRPDDFRGRERPNVRVGVDLSAGFDGDRAISDAA